MSDITREDLATWKLRATLPSQANNWVMTGPEAVRLIALVEELAAAISEASANASECPLCQFTYGDQVHADRCIVPKE